MAAYDKGYSVLLMDTDERAEREAELLRNLSGQADGVIACSPRSPAEVLTPITEHTPLVLVNRTAPEKECGNSSTTCMLLGIATSSTHPGCRRRGPTGSVATPPIGKLGMNLTVLGPYQATFDGGVMAADAVVAIAATAAVAFDDIMAMGVLRRLTERGLRVPEQIRVSGCDDVFFCGHGIAAVDVHRDADSRSRTHGRESVA